MEHHINVFYLSASQMKTKAVGFQPWKKSSCCNNKKGRSSLPCQSLSYKSISTCSKLLQGHVHKNSITVDKKKKKDTGNFPNQKRNSNCKNKRWWKMNSVWTQNVVYLFWPLHCGVYGAFMDSVLYSCKYIAVFGLRHLCTYRWPHIKSTCYTTMQSFIASPVQPQSSLTLFQSWTTDIFLYLHFNQLAQINLN